MKILKTKEEVILQFSESKLQAPNKLTSTKYNDKVTFDCGCGTAHRVNDPSNRVFATALPVKMVIDCENGYVTFFQIKGFFQISFSGMQGSSRKLHQVPSQSGP